jgi:hypothetical protein
MSPALFALARAARLLGLRWTSRRLVDLALAMETR